MNDQRLKENKFRLLETRNKKPSLMALMLKSEFLLTPLSTPSAPYVHLTSFFCSCHNYYHRQGNRSRLTNDSKRLMSSYEQEETERRGKAYSAFCSSGSGILLHSQTLDFRQKQQKNGFNTICISKCVIKKFQYNDPLPPPSSSIKKKPQKYFII